MAIENSQLTDTQLDLLTVPAGKTYAITSIMVCNTYSPNDPSPENETASFDMHFIKSGQSLGNQTTCVVRELELPAGETFTFDSEKVILEEGDRIVLLGESPTVLSATVSYLEV